MTEPTPLERIHAGYPDDPGRKVRRRVAAGFEPDARLEEFLGWRTSDPERFAALPNVVRLSVGHCEECKLAAAQTP